MKDVAKIRLEEDDFRCLVSGGILTINIPSQNKQISIILADIGFHQMGKALEEAYSGDLKAYSHLTKTY